MFLQFKAAQMSLITVRLVNEYKARPGWNQGSPVTSGLLIMQNQVELHGMPWPDWPPVLINSCSLLEDWQEMTGSWETGVGGWVGEGGDVYLSRQISGAGKRPKKKHLSHRSVCPRVDRLT